MQHVIADRIGGKIECQATLTLAAFRTSWPQCSIIVEGGATLSGTIRPSGNKNAALPIIAASLLSEHPVTLSKRPSHSRHRNAGRARYARSARAPTGPSGTRSRSTRNPSAPSDLDPELCRKIRASILLAGPLLARCGEITLPPPGGDVIGRRRLDTHFLALERLGADVTADDKFELRAKTLVGADVFLDEPSVTATENALVAATAARGNDDPSQCRERAARAGPRAFPRARWARESMGSAPTPSPSTAGRPSAAGTHRIGPDHIEVGSFIGLAAVTRLRDSHPAGWRRAPSLHAAWLRAPRYHRAGSRATI